MTTTAYEIVKKAIAEKRATVTASPAAARKFLAESGLLSVLEGKTTTTRKSKAVQSAALKRKAR
jgi:hypothetical protein